MPAKPLGGAYLLTNLACTLYVASKGAHPALLSAGGTATNGMLVPVSLVKSLLFCPARVYVEFGLGVVPRYEGEAGRQAHAAYALLTKALYERGRITEGDVEEACRAAPALGRAEIERIARFRERVGLAGVPVRAEVEVSSPELGLAGRVDLLEGSHPVEVKYRGRPTRADVLQLALYALILGREGLDCRVGYIDLLKSGVRVPVLLDRLAPLAERVAAELRRAAFEPMVPESPPCGRCDVRVACRMLALSPLRGGSVGAGVRRAHG